MFLALENRFKFEDREDDVSILNNRGYRSSEDKNT